MVVEECEEREDGSDEDCFQCLGGVAREDALST